MIFYSMFRKDGCLTGGTDMKQKSNLGKVILTVILSLAAFFGLTVGLLLLSFGGFWTVTKIASTCLIWPLILFVWMEKRTVFHKIYVGYLFCFIALFGVQLGMDAYKDSITIDVTPNINTYEYRPFDEASKIVKIDSKLLDFSQLPKEELPVIDGATAAFPVYSAFVHAVYPEDTKLYDDVFEYNNTVGGYKALARKETDVFIGAAPSQEQIAYGEGMGTVFEYTQIGSEAFVFFVHRDNPIDSLTVEQIRGIYSGAITNWSQVGGEDEKIVPFQRPANSGSQSMLIRFMGDTPIIEPDTETAVGGMGDIIEKVADYKNKSTSIGFSFRFYVEGMIKNPDIKLIAIDGVTPTVENIQNGTYPMIAPVYAVTYEGNPKESVKQLIDWIQSEEGQYIINETGYVGLGR